jgi:hypothetical protein
MLLRPAPRTQIYPGLFIFVLGRIICLVGKWMTTGEAGKFHNYYKLINTSYKLKMTSEACTSSYIYVTTLTLQIQM